MLNLNDYDAVVALFDEAKAKDDPNDPFEVIFEYCALANVQVQQQKYYDALFSLNKALDLCHRQNLQEMFGWQAGCVYQDMAIVYQLLDYPHSAHESMTKSEELLRRHRRESGQMDPLFWDHFHELKEAMKAPVGVDAKKWSQLMTVTVSDEANYDADPLPLIGAEIFACPEGCEQIAFGKILFGYHGPSDDEQHCTLFGQLALMEEDWYYVKIHYENGRMRMVPDYWNHFQRFAYPYYVFTDSQEACDWAISRNNTIIEQHSHSIRWISERKEFLADDN